jgi:hypothetical protein
MFFVVTLISLLLITGLAEAKEVQGQIVAVNETEEVLLLKNDTGVKQYQLSFDATIRLNNEQVDLRALRPMDYKSFCEAELKVNQSGVVTDLQAAYRAIKATIVNISDDTLLVRKTTTGAEREFEFNQGVAITRNNLQVDLDDLSAGDRGLIILGLNDQIQKIVMHNYQVYGFLKEVKHQNRTILVNTASRLQPEYKKFTLSQNTQIEFKQQEIKLKDLTANMWLKLEVEQGIKKVVAKKI